MIMSKNIKLNDTVYEGVSTIQVLTENGGTAQFKDVEEITTPNGNITITANGTHDVSKYASALVNVPTQPTGESTNDNVKSYTFTLDSDFELTQYITKDIAILEENTSLDVENNTYSAFVVFGEDTTSGKPLYMFTPKVSKGIKTSFNTTQSLLIVSQGSYIKEKQLVQVYVNDDNALALGFYSSGTTWTIPAGTYTVYVVKNI
jgi:hypothetical protein